MPVAASNRTPTAAANPRLRGKGLPGMVQIVESESRHHDVRTRTLRSSRTLGRSPVTYGEANVAESRSHVPVHQSMSSQTPPEAHGVPVQSAEQNSIRCVAAHFSQKENA
jgi:hypothetical protein